MEKTLLQILIFSIKTFDWQDILRKNVTFDKLLKQAYNLPQFNSIENRPAMYSDKELWPNRLAVTECMNLSTWDDSQA